MEASAALHPFAHPELSISSIAAHEAGGAEPKQPSTHGGNELALPELPDPIELGARVLYTVDDCTPEAPPGSIVATVAEAPAIRRGTAVAIVGFATGSDDGLDN
jgi:hypothetical protein